MKKWFISLLVMVSLTTSGPAFSQTCPPQSWPLWELFKQHFIQKDGRVLDASTPQQQSTSEGQSYAMFFALIANDRPAFEQLWQWSIHNLFDGDATTQLPAWLWGKNDKGQWGVLDVNSASDADIWFTYALLEAGRLWNEPIYTQAAYSLLAQIELKELEDIPQLGAMLLPGEMGFKHKNQWILNSSYLFTPLFRRLHKESPLSQWGEVADHSITVLEQTTPKGFAADWVTYQHDSKNQSFSYLLHKPDQKPIGSYDAIRNYMWAGMMAEDDMAKQKSLVALRGMKDYLLQHPIAPPEKVNVETAEAVGQGPFGFSAAVLPYLKAWNETELFDQQQRRANVLLRQSVLPANVQKKQPSYYDFVLSLFGLGWAEGRYRFDKQGMVWMLWEEKPCQTSGND